GFGVGLSLPGAVPRTGRSSADISGGGNVIAPGYFAAMGISLVAGRDFGNQDAPGASLVAIVGDAAAGRFWPGQNAVGKSIVVNGLGMTGATLQVVGVVHDVQYRSLNFGTPPFVYVPQWQHYQPEATLVVRAHAGRSAAGEV